MSDTMEKMSKASCSDIGQFVLVACARGLRTAPNRPISKLAKPFCSLFSESVFKGPNVSKGRSPKKALVTNSPPSHPRPVSSRILCATPFVASKTA